MRVILDTNVLVSGVFFGGLPRQILEAWRGGDLRVVVSPEILDEYERVGARLAQQFEGVGLHPFLQLLGVHGELVEAIGLVEPATRDPADDKFLACALAAGVRVIISGDEDLHEVSGWRGVEVVRPADFCRRFLKHGDD